MRSFFATLRQLIIPAGSPPGSPRIVIGPDLPADLVAYYAALGIGTPPVAVGGLVFYLGVNYCYLIEVDYGPAFVGPSLACGTRNSNGVAELWAIQPAAGFGGAMTLGTDVNTTIAVDNEMRFDNGAQSQATFASGSTLQVEPDAAWTIDAVSQPRGLRARIGSTANSAAVGAEATVLTAPAMSFVQGRAYEVRWRGQTASSGANTTTYRVRLTNLAGAILDVYQHPFAAAATDVLGETITVRRTSATGNDQLVLTLQASVGTSTMAGAATNVRYLQVVDCGAAADYPDAIAI